MAQVPALSPVVVVAAVIVNLLELCVGLSDTVKKLSGP
jgi:hypothetical protein